LFPPGVTIGTGRFEVKRAGSDKDVRLQEGAPEIPGKGNSMRRQLLPPPLVLRGRVGVGVAAAALLGDWSLPMPPTKNPHLDPPPGYKGRRKRRLPGNSGTLTARGERWSS
jgi:hypothetical protein